MEKIKLDFRLEPSTIRSDKEKFDISNLSFFELKRIMNGEISIFFESQDEYILLQSGIFDYLIQLKGVIEDIQRGNLETFSVSCDWYNNSLDYKYDPKTDSLVIREANAGEFEITTKFKSFENAFQNFYRKTLEQLTRYYPELRTNDVFINSKW